MKTIKDRIVAHRAKIDAAKLDVTTIAKYYDLDELSEFCLQLQTKSPTHSVIAKLALYELLYIRLDKLEEVE